MPEVTTTLSHEEVKMACWFWVRNGCPPVDGVKVFLNSTPGSDDPREPSGPQITASVSGRPAIPPQPAKG